MMIRNKWLMLLLTGALITVLVLATGCSNDEQPTADREEEPKEEGGGFVLGEQPLEFTFYGNYDWYTMPNWGDDAATEWIQENKKVTVKPINSGGNAEQKYSTMIASNDLPDVIWMERDAEVEKLRAAGMLVPFDDYLDKYPNLKEWAGESTIDMLRSPDGKLYQFPNWYTTQPNGNAGYVVNKKIYEELGSPTLETTDDLYNYLKQVKEEYPDVVPFEAGFNDADGINVLYSAFGEDHPSSFVSMHGVPNGDELNSIFTDPVFRESILFASQLFRENLISQDTLTQTKDQFDEKVMAGKVAVFANASPTEIASLADRTLKQTDPDAGYFMIWPVHKEGLDKNKIWPGTYTQLGWNVNVITTAAENPEAIFAFLDWLTGPEGMRVIFWGPEGLYWDGTDDEGAPQFTEKFTTDTEEVAKLMNTTNNFQWVGNTVFADNSKMKFESTLPVEQRNWESHWQSEITWKTQYNATEFINLNPETDSDEGIIAQRVSDIFTEARARAFFASSDEEVLAILDKAEEDAQTAGYDQLLAFKTERWQENLETMAGN